MKRTYFKIRKLYRSIRHLIFSHLPEHLKRISFSNDIYMEEWELKSAFKLIQIKNFTYREEVFTYTFKYRFHDFFVIKNQKEPYEIFDSMTGLSTNIKIKRIKKLKECKDGNELDVYLTKIVLNPYEYDKQIKKFQNSPIY